MGGQGVKTTEVEEISILKIWRTIISACGTKILLQGVGGEP